MYAGDPTNTFRIRGKATSTDGGGILLSTLMRQRNYPDVVYLPYDEGLTFNEECEGIYHIDIDKFMKSKVIILAGNEWPVVILPYKKTPGVPHP